MIECVCVCERESTYLLEDLEGDGAVVVLQGRDVIVANCQLCPGIDLVAGDHMTP